MMASGFVIENVSVLPLTAPLIYPFRTALGQHDHLDNVLFCLKLSGGVAGEGEAAVATHITGETVSTTMANLCRIGQDLIGQDVRSYRKISQKVHAQYPENKAVIAAVEMALLDALTQVRGIPLWKFFGPTPQRLTTDITIVIASLAETKKATREFYAQGFRSFKVKVGRDPELDFDRVVAVKRLAPRGKIIIDANQGYSSAQMIAFLKKLKAVGVRPALLEQPVPKDDLDGMAAVKSAQWGLVCADESVRSLDDCRKIIRRKAADVINIKLMKTGLLESVAIALLVRKNGLKLMIGGMMESALAMTAAAHLASGLGGFDYVDLDTPFFVKGELARLPYLNARGVYDLRKVKAGIGVTRGSIFSPSQGGVRRGAQ